MNILKQYIPFICIAILMMGVAVYFTCSRSGNEIAQYAKDYPCGVSKKANLTYRSELPTEYNIDAVLFELQEELRVKINSPIKFTRVSYTVSDLVFRIAPKDNEDCAYFKLDAPKGTQLTTLAWTDTYPSKDSPKYGTFICVDKYREALKIELPRRHIYRLGKMRGIIRHEALHYLIGPNHPAWGCSLMCSGQESSSLSGRELKILEGIVKGCR